MAAEADDWRLTNQENYLTGVTLQWSRWTQRRPDWDHDHCEFCFAKFMEAPEPETLKLIEADDSEILQWGYTTSDRYRWICETCFQDFRDRFGWQVESESE
jgi:hypothetical protein